MTAADSPAQVSPSGQVVVITPEGGSDGAGGQAQAEGAGALLSAPDKVMRIGTMVKQLLEEVRSAPLDERSRVRMRELYQQSIKELSDGLSPELRAELDRLALPLSEEEAPSDAELRVAQAQLVGWLEGVFHGIQAALVAQQVNARLQLENMRGRPQLPGGAGAGSMVAPGGATGTGQYL